MNWIIMISVVSLIVSGIARLRAKADAHKQRNIAEGVRLALRDRER